jgi:hypothetical protein
MTHYLYDYFLALKILKYKFSKHIDHASKETIWY